MNELGRGLTIEKWRTLGRQKQMLNIASELTRAKNLILENQPKLAQQSLERVFELVDLTVENEQPGTSHSFIRELLRFRESLGELYLKPDGNEEELRNLLKGFLDLNSETHNLGLEI